MLKEDAVSQILTDTDFIEDPEEREAGIGPLIDEAIADADGEIDGYLAKRYAVPLAPVPKVINKFSKDIALYNLPDWTKRDGRATISPATTPPSSSSRWSRRAKSASELKPAIPRQRRPPASPCTPTAGSSAGIR